MTRPRRLYAPQGGFHITARTQFGEKWFKDESRDEYVDIMCEAVSTFGHTLLAFVLMPNHFHIVLRQSDAPLGWMMQRVMQRIALRVRKKHNLEGHIFGRRFWSEICPTPAYLRRAIVYAHLNPCEAKICGHPGDFHWSSHNAYVNDSAPWNDAFNPRDALTLFARESLEIEDMRANYMWFVNYTIERRRSGIPGDWLLSIGPHRLFIPPAPLGDEHFATTYSSGTGTLPAQTPDIPTRDAAAAILRRIDPECDLDTVRNGGSTRPVCALRRQIIEGLMILGYRTNAIARCMRVSQSLVSHIKASMRCSANPQYSGQDPGGPASATLQS